MSWGLDGVSAVRGGATVLHDVTVDVAPGAIVAVVGADGSGKSSLLQVFAGLLSPSAGRARAPRRSRLGFLPASSGVYPDLSATENLRFAAAVHGLPGRVAADRVVSLLEVTGLAALADRPGGLLSGGTRQKLGVAMSLVHRPDLLILDEPTTGVDPVSRADLWWLMAREAARGCAIALSTTYLDEAERAGHVVVLDAGRVLLRGTPADIVAAMPGQIRAVRARPSDPYAWRRGRSWRVWEPSGDGAGELVRPDLQDAVVLAALREAVDGGRA